MGQCKFKNAKLSDLKEEGKLIMFICTIYIKLYIITYNK